MNEFKDTDIITLTSELKLAFEKDMQLFEKVFNKEIILYTKYPDLLYFGKFFGETGLDMLFTAKEISKNDGVVKAYENISISSLKKIPCWWMDSIALPRSVRLSDVRPKIARKFFYIIVDNLFWNRYQTYEEERSLRIEGEACQRQKDIILKALYLFLGVNPYTEENPTEVGRLIRDEIDNLIEEFDMCLSKRFDDEEDDKNIRIDNLIFFYRVEKLKGFLEEAREFLDTIKIFWKHNNKKYFDSKVKNISTDILNKLWDGTNESLANEVRSEYHSASKFDSEKNMEEKDIKLSLLYKPISTFSSIANQSMPLKDLEDKLLELNSYYRSAFLYALPPQKHNNRKSPFYKSLSDEDIWNFKYDNNETARAESFQEKNDKKIILGRDQESKDIFMLDYDESWSLFIEKTFINVPRAQSIDLVTNIMKSILLNLFFKTDPSDVWIMIYDFMSDDFENYDDLGHMPTPVIKNEKDALKSFTYLLDVIDKKYEFKNSSNSSRSDDNIKKVFDGSEDANYEVSAEEDSRIENTSEEINFKNAYIFIKDIGDFEDNTLLTMISLIAKRGPKVGINLIVGSQTQFKYKKRLPTAQYAEKVEKEKAVMPSTDLLERAFDDEGSQSEPDLKQMTQILESSVNGYVSVESLLSGPVVTRFDIEIRAYDSQQLLIKNIAQDIARSFSVSSVKVDIKDRSSFGIEIPNANRKVIALHEILSSNAFKSSPSSLSLALGHDISGNPIVVDLARMPHLLVAGTTGSGKSVGLNAMLLSLLFKSDPEDVKLILIDPKMLELQVYNDIPHLLTPVITDMKDAWNALNKCAGEMDRRYELMSMMGIRNLDWFNKKIQEAEKNGKQILNPLNEDEDKYLEVLPSIVVVVEELADMMMLVGKKAEHLIARIAQKGRAVGIHLILATQRPSVDVITRLIKENIPARIGFQVSTEKDSRMILGQGGAEQLLGNGDMLYLSPGEEMPVRVHGAFVGGDEVDRVVNYWKSIKRPNYNDGFLESKKENDNEKKRKEKRDLLIKEMRSSKNFLKLESVENTEKEFSLYINEHFTHMLCPINISPSDEERVIARWEKVTNPGRKLAITGDKYTMKRGYDIDQVNNWLQTKRFHTKLTKAVVNEVFMRDVLMEIFKSIKDRKLKTNSSIEKEIKQKIL